jgi:AcrR family transcriptional regulator
MAAKPTREERRDERTTEIVDIAARLFAEHGYAETGVSELCDAVGLGRGALYHYIESKDRLLGRIHQRVTEILIPHGQAIVDGPGSAPDKLRAFGELTIGTIAAYPDHVWVFMHERKGLSGELREQLRVQRHAFESQLASILEQGVHEGSFAVDDTRLAVLAWFGMHNYTYQSLRLEQPYDGDAVAAAFFTIFVSGISRSADASEAT